METWMLLLALAAGGALGWLLCRWGYAARSTALATERDLLRERVVDLEAAVGDDAQTAAALAPLREALGRVEQQVGTLERDRTQQFAALEATIGHVQAATSDLGKQTRSLAGSLNSSSVRGAWGEVQLRRVLEHAGLLARCDFDEQVSATARHGTRVRPDVVVSLPGGKHLVVDAKAPMRAFLEAQADDTAAAARERLLDEHAAALRSHVTSLAAKEYWTAFAATPEMVVCFVPTEAMLSVALARDPALHEEAMARRVVLVGPGALLALLRTVAFTWQQDALTGHARELMELGKELYGRLATLGGHAVAMGRALQRSVETYNQLVGALETRVLVTARRMHELDLAPDRLDEVPPVQSSPRPLTAVELLEAVAADTRPELDLPETPSNPRRSGEQAG